LKEEYEYAIIPLPIHTDPKTMVEVLNKRAKEGWKLVGTKFGHRWFTKLELENSEQAEVDILILEKREILDV